MSEWLNWSQNRLLVTLGIYYFIFAELLSLVSSDGASCVVNPANYGEYYAEKNECPAFHVFFFKIAAAIFEKLGDPNWVIAIFTVVLAGSTIALWLATRNLVHGADETSQSQLRPYLEITPKFLHHFRPGQKIRFGYLQVNVGVTPAYSAVQYGAIQMLPYPLPQNFPFPKQFDLTRSKMMLMPRSPITGNILAESSFTAEELIQALEAPHEGRRLYVFGQISFRDAFKRDHWRRFAMSFNGFLPMIEPAKQGNWDLVEQVIAQNPIEFEWTTQHNETDES